MRKFDVELAIGYDHGTWELETVRVELHKEEISPGYEEVLFNMAEEIFEEDVGYNKDIAFYHHMYITEIED